LCTREGSDAVRAGTQRSAKYVEKVITATDRRRVEQQIIEDKMLKKDAEKNQQGETFITSGFKEELKRRKKFEDELEQQEINDQKKAAENLQNERGLSGFYQNLLGSGLASARGAEIVKAQAAAREGDGKVVGAAPRSAAAQALAAKASAAVKEETPDEDTLIAAKKESDSEMDIKEEVKLEEPAASDGPIVDASDASGPAPSSPAPGPALPQVAMEALAAAAKNKRPRDEEEAEQRETKVMSAKERFLARKKAAAEAAAAAGEAP